MKGAQGEGSREIANTRGGTLLSQAPASAVSISSITVKSAASASSEIWTRTVAWEGSLVKATWRCACQDSAAIWTDVPAISMQARGPAKNSPRANRAAIASGTTEARIFKRNMTRYPLTISPRQGAYGWQRVKETSYRRVDAGCFLLARHLQCEWGDAIRGCSHKGGRHTRRMRGIQHAATSRFNHCCLQAVIAS